MKTYGCSNNVAESEMMMGMLNSSGHAVKESSEYKKADVVVFNMCSVKGPSVQHCMNEIRKIKKENPKKKVVVTGCVPRQLIPELREIDETVSIANTHHIEKINHVVESSLNMKPSEYKHHAKPIKLNFPRLRKNKIISIVPILQGCNDFCTYCSTKLVKGNTFSYPEAKIIEEVKVSLADGCKEVWLTSQDNGAYMTDKQILGLPKLVDSIASLDGDFFIRIGMANPTYILQCLDEFISALKQEKVYKFAHIPVQSGNNDVLKNMKRRYTVEDYKEIVGRIKKEIPWITIATDIICGFPGESTEAFEDTLNLIRDTEPDVVNISRFHARPGTKAAKMKQLSGGVIKERSGKLTTLFHELGLEKNRKWIGKECYVLIDEHGKKGDDSIGRTSSYKQVVIKKKLKLGSIVNVKITNAKTHYLEGCLISSY